MKVLSNQPDVALPVNPCLDRLESVDLTKWKDDRAPPNDLFEVGTIPAVPDLDQIHDRDHEDDLVQV